MECKWCKYFFSEADIYRDKNLSGDEGICNHPERDPEMSAGAGEGSGCPKGA